MLQPNLHGRQTALIAALCAGLACNGEDGAPPRETTGTSASSNDNGTYSDDGSVEYCIPNEVRCRDQQFLETCAPTGREWLAEPCPPNAFCRSCGDLDETCAFDHCVSPCDIPPEFSSSTGCSFLANRQLHPFQDYPDGIILGNPSTDLTATVQVFKIPEGKRREELEAEFLLLPGEARTYEITTSFIMGTGSMFRTGGMFRVVSDVPLIGYQHSPLENNQANDSQLLLPENVLGTDYIILSYPPINTALGGQPSYFEIIALEDQTTVAWTPKQHPTHGNGLPIKPVGPGETGTVKMNRFDTMRITASASDSAIPIFERDLSGTTVHADKPIWVVGATRCTGAPVLKLDLPNHGTCNNVQELLFPLNQWGRKYIATAPPPRDTEETHWRIYAGAPDITVTSTPPHDGFPHTFASPGDFVDISVPPQEHLLLDGDGPFMPVLHLQAATVRTDQEGGRYPPGTIRGDTSMAQMVPVEQFLDRYVFITGEGYLDNWAVIVRESGSAEITIDGTVVDNYEPVGDYEVAHFPLTNSSGGGTSTHRAESNSPFGLLQVGYSRNDCAGSRNADGCANPAQNSTCGDGSNLGLSWCNSSYAHPGGMKSEALFIP